MVVAVYFATAPRRVHAAVLGDAGSTPAPASARAIVQVLVMPYQISESTAEDAFANHARPCRESETGSHFVIFITNKKGKQHEHEHDSLMADRAPVAK